MTSAVAEPDRVRFRRLAYLTAALTFALIVVGGVVRISDSGLGCGAAGSGTEGWPPSDPNMPVAKPADKIDFLKINREMSGRP